MSTNSIIQTGTTFRLFDSSVQTHNVLPRGTYKISFDPMSGYSLVSTDPLVPGEGKIYGTHEARLERMYNAYQSMNRSMGVLLSGDKGMGKSLMIRLLADKFSREQDIPVVIVDNNTPGLPDFIDTLGECVVVFDEFEKKFGRTESSFETRMVGEVGTENKGQTQFLSLFDGMSTHNRIYLVSVNNVSHLSDFIINRPGRFHYHIRFDYPTADEALEYLTDQAPSADPEEISAAVQFSQKIKINYDHLRAIAFELELGGKFADVIGDLNIKNIASVRYKVTGHLPNGKTVSTSTTLDMFSSELVLVNVYNSEYDIYFRFSPESVQFINGVSTLSGADAQVDAHSTDKRKSDSSIDEDKREPIEQADYPTHYTFTVEHGSNYTF